MATKQIVGIVIVLVIVAAIAVLLSSNSRSGPSTTTAPGVSTIQQASSTVSSTSGQNVPTPVLATDPEHVPAGTQAVLVTYSSVQAHTTGTAGSGWVSAAGSGTLNLTAITNVSRVIATANVSANATINLVRFNITSARIVVNGTSYNVTLPSSNLTVAVTSSAKINQSTGAAILIDITPTIAAVFSNNSESFVMAPAARATVVTNVSAEASTGVGASVSLNAEARANLAAAAPSISITNASLGVSGNVTTLSLTVTDNSNASAGLNNIFIYGKQQAEVNASVAAQASGGANTSGIIPVNAGGHGKIGLGLNVSGSILANITAHLALHVQTLNALDFAVSGSGTLSLPSSGASFRSSGVAIAAGSSAKLTFSGVVAYNSGTLIVKPEAGEQYQVTVTGPAGAEASTVVTAT